MAKKAIKKINKTLNTRRAARWMWIVLFAPVAALFLLLLLTASGMFGKLPTFEELENPKSNLATMVYSEDGEVIGSYFYQNRTYTSYEELSPNLVAALIATEDARFYSHSGIDFMGLARVAVKTVALGQNQGGGSTITQQLAKNLYKTREDEEYNINVGRKGRLLFSKLKEWITAVGLEYNYTKEEIIAMYLNTVEYGNNAYGIKSAAQTYFNKLPDELTIEEAALLVGVVNAPTKYSPTRNPKQSVARRNVVISRMEDRNFITRAERDSLTAIPLTLDFQRISHDTGVGTYFREMLRQVMTQERPTRSSTQTDWDYQQALAVWDNNPIYGWCHKNLKSDGTRYDLHSDGLRIYTTLNSSMQRYAEEAMTEHMREELQPKMDQQVKNYKRLFNDINQEQIDGIINRAIVGSERYQRAKRGGLSHEQILKQFDQPVDMQVFSYTGERDTVMTPRDSVYYHKQIMRASFMAMDPKTGHVKAYVGGPEFKYFKYDMVKTGKRQVGSTIKPFVYTFAIDNLGLSPCEPVPNRRVMIETANGEPWMPKEASSVDYNGEIHPLKWGLIHSRNNYSAWIMKRAGNPQTVADYIHKLGIRDYIDPVPSLCLGSSDVTLFEMVATYATYVNNGVYTDPLFVTRIEDRYGNVLATFTAQTTDVMSEQTAYTMLRMLQEVVDSGTGNRVKRLHGVGLNGDAGGKTGTSQLNSDAWFMGVTPNLAGGAWVGGEDRSIRYRSGADGARVALPIFGKFMEKVYADKTLGISDTDRFVKPMGVEDYNCSTTTYYNPYHYDLYGPREFFE